MCLEGVVSTFTESSVKRMCMTGVIHSVSHLLQLGLLIKIFLFVISAGRHNNCYRGIYSHVTFLTITPGNISIRLSCDLTCSLTKQGELLSFDEGRMVPLVPHIDLSDVGKKSSVRDKS